MGLGGSALQYEGYGRTREEAVLALDAFIRFHYDGIYVKRLDNRYFVWNGAQEYKIYYERLRKYIRAFILV